MIKKYIDFIKRQKAKAKKIREDDYLTRLSNSLYGYCGHSHMGEGPFLGTDEVQDLMRKELERRID